MEKDILILAVESSCDETAAAVVKNGREVLSNIISSQIALHTLYGGVVPEIASRKHIEAIDGVITQALQEAGVTLEDIDAIGVTYGPGLVGALLVGLAEAKALAFAANKPLVGVHHIEGHICANYIENKDFEPPYMALVCAPAVIPIWCMCPITASTKFWAEPEMTPLVRLMTKLPVPSVWVIPAARKSMQQPKKAIPML